MARKTYGTIKCFENSVVQSVEVGNPTEIMNAAFVEVFYKGKKKFPKPKRVGKWLFFVAEKYIDDTWNNLKKAVKAGKLWSQAKASTAWRSKGSVYVVCVYTYDYQDEKDVMQIRQILRDMGFKRQASYKTDEQTDAGVYSEFSAGLAVYKA